MNPDEKTLTHSKINKSVFYDFYYHPFNTFSVAYIKKNVSYTYWDFQNVTKEVDIHGDKYIVIPKNVEGYERERYLTVELIFPIEDKEEGCEVIVKLHIDSLLVRN
jgi:hypothetical protein